MQLLSTTERTRYNQQSQQNGQVETNGHINGHRSGYLRRYTSRRFRYITVYINGVYRVSEVKVQFTESFLE